MKSEKDKKDLQDGVAELAAEVGGDVSKAYVIRLLKKQNIPITPETISVKTQNLLIGRFKGIVKKMVDKKE